MLVRELMKPNPKSVGGETGFMEAVGCMAANACSCLVVIDQRRPVGIVTERDVLNTLSKGIDESRLESLKVVDVMTPDPVCVSETTELGEALTLSRSRKFRHIPVVDDQDALTGLVTQNDLLDAFAAYVETQVELESTLAELKLLSLEDPLMRVGNRRAMEVDLAYSEAEASRHGKVFSVALLDVDFFKRYNDRYQHQAGDDALRQVATAIKRAVRDSDRVFRYGGEEILVLMPESDLEAARVGMERVRAGIEAMGLMHEDGLNGVLTVSIGLATFRQNSWREMVTEADQALYEAKKAGRNRVHT